MGKYIEKEKIVLEIERRIEKMFPMVGFSTTAKGVNMQLASKELRSLLSFINTLEVKEF